MSRIPSSCPTNFSGRYIVNPGDTMFKIASIFRVSLTELIRANPHIINPSVIFPGDILCVPGQISFPCCATLDVVQPAELGEAGVALVYTSFVGTQAVSVMAVLGALPAGFDIWIAEVEIPNVVIGRQQLYPTPQTPPTFSGTIFFPTAATLTPETIVRVFPVNSVTGNQGSIKLQGNFRMCNL